MIKQKKWLAVAACAVIAGIAVFLIILNTRGVPAIDAASYTQGTAELAQAAELKALPGGSGGVPGMKLVAQTDDLALYYHAETTEVAVEDKRSGKIWRSSPAERDSDAKASPFEKESMASPANISFRDAVGNLETYTSFGQSISKKQFTAESIESGIRVTYTLGDQSLGIEALPRLISKKRLEEKVLSRLDEATARYVGLRYYPLSTNKEVLERMDAQLSRQLVLNKMLAAFEKAGYTREDLAFDNEENGIAGGAASDRPNFTVPLEYRLDGDSLLVSVPVAQIKESEAYRIRSIELLGYFGAAGLEEKGYMFVPDGTGSLIYLNNGKVKNELYAQRLYGDDYNDNSGRRGQVAQSARMPVFGLKSGDDAWFAVIEQGDGIAGINADISGKQNSYNHVYSSFAVRGEDSLELYKGNQVESIQLLSEQRYEGDIKVRYSFLSGEDADYSGMAKLYRNRLVEQGVLKPLRDSASIPFYVDMLGAIEKRRTFLGIPYDALVSMTSFEQAGQIAEQLQSDGITNIQMRFMGWFNKGLNHKLPVNMKVDGVLGGKPELKALEDKLAEIGGRLYPDVAFQQVYQNDRNFTPSSDAARFLTKEEAARTPFNPAFNAMDFDLGIYYLLSPAKLPYYVDQFIDRYASYGTDAVAIRDLGELVYSDYRVNRVIFRETAKNIITGQLGKIKEKFPNTLLTGGNAYALPYAEQVVNVPTSTSKFNIADEEVPFYQMVLHGFVDYAGSPINLDDEQDMKRQMLRSLELGAAPHFLWSYEPSSKLKYTRFDTMYSTDYAAWYDDAVAMYKEVNAVLSGLRTKAIERRVRYADGVVEVRYEDGTSVLVNYTDQPVAINGTRIDAQDYAVGGGQG
ncbi:DUF5696 domain-containing protein [uncultured Paenibacillus sp.]|uniref:DUF5696 domain-containing protein n=1 Tax=uncultured Paenibacillus sp. TaxID=227322 RepID=UPI0028CFF388|nr:DUF5696 domain-containing protein [uncultured Paenibacillus sp.]